MQNPSKEESPFECKDHVYKGVRFASIIPVTVLDAMKTFEVRSDDIWLITYPKSGTTWTLDIINQILVKAGAIEADDQRLDHSVYLEFNLPPRPNFEVLADTPSPRLILTHLPHFFLPPQLEEKKPKIVYVARNPKDVVLSYMYHLNIFPTCESYDSLDDFIQDFKTGKVVYGKWQPEVLYWSKRKEEKNVLFLTYEDMTKIPEFAVRQIAELLEYNLSDDAIKEIREATNYEAVIKRTFKPHDDHLKAFGIDPKDSPYVRKGKVGGWKNQFTVAQNEEFDKWYDDVIGDSGLTFDFDG
ncbi:sulfotransferase 1B1-like isoform X2 [Glandiceps talaboti]